MSRAVPAFVGRQGAPQFTAVVVAGERVHNRSERALGAHPKAFIPVGGVPMLVRVLQALAQSANVARIAVVGEATEHLASAPQVKAATADLGLEGRLSFHEGGCTPVESVLKLHREGRVSAPLLVATADLPFLSCEAVDTFCRRLARLGPVDFAAGLIEAGFAHQLRPGMKRTFIRFAEGRYKGCNLFAVVTPAGWIVLEKWRTMERLRKQAVMLIFRLLGPADTVRMVSGHLGLEGAFARLSRAWGCRVAPVLMRDPMLSLDIDRREHLTISAGLLARGAATPEKPPVAVFDLDGTITRYGTFTPFLLFAAARRRPWRLALLPAVPALMGLYKLGGISRRSLKTAMHSLLLGRIRRDAITPVVRNFVAFCRRMTRAGALATIEWERRHGSRLYIATAAQDVYAEPLARALGFDGVIATQSRWRGDLLLPGSDGENCRGGVKQARIAETLKREGIIDAEGQHPHITYYADRIVDLPALLWADEGVVVNPGRRLKRAAIKEGLVIVRW